MTARELFKRRPNGSYATINFGQIYDREVFLDQLGYILFYQSMGEDSDLFVEENLLWLQGLVDDARIIWEPTEDGGITPTSEDTWTVSNANTNTQLL